MSPEKMGIRQAAPVPASLTQQVPPGMNLRGWTHGSPVPATPLGPIPMLLHNSFTVHLTQLASVPPFSREKPVQAGHIPQALSGGAAGTDVPCGGDQLRQEETLPFEGPRQARGQIVLQVIHPESWI